MVDLKPYEYYYKKIKELHINENYEFNKLMFESFKKKLKKYNGDIEIDDYLNINCKNCVRCCCCIDCDDCNDCMDCKMCGKCGGCISCFNCFKCVNCINIDGISGSFSAKLPYTKKFKTFEYYLKNINDLDINHKFNKDIFNNIIINNFYKYSIIDKYLNINCKKCFGCYCCKNCIECVKCYHCFKSINCKNCNLCSRCKNCTKCINCFECNNSIDLINKEYY